MEDLESCTKMLYFMSPVLIGLLDTKLSTARVSVANTQNVNLTYFVIPWAL